MKASLRILFCKKGLSKTWTSLMPGSLLNREQANCMKKTFRFIPARVSFVLTDLKITKN